MSNTEKTRLSRLISLITLLQSTKMFTTSDFARKFEVSKRTIYRDLKTLEEAGIPITTEAGKGYTLMDGYRLPPVMLTKEEANALITAEKLVLINKDTSLIKNYNEAITKIKSVLNFHSKEKIDILSNRIEFWKDQDNKIDFSNVLSTVQNAIADFNVVKIEYLAAQKNEVTQREIEPFAVINKVGESWYLIAWCRTRQDFRLFRFDRIINLQVLNDRFIPHKITLSEYLEKYRKDNFSNR